MGADQRCVVGDDHSGARMAVAEPLLQPAAAGQVQLARVVGGQRAPAGAELDLTVIVDDALGQEHRLGPAVGAGDEIAPERAAEVAHAVDDQLVVLEDVDRRSCRGPA